MTDISRTPEQDADYAKWKASQKPVVDVPTFLSPSPAEIPFSPDSDPQARDPREKTSFFSPDTNEPAPQAKQQWVYVKYPDGSVHAVDQSEIDGQVAPKSVTARQDGPGVQPVTEPVVQEFYVHLADGSVERVAQPDLPVAGGTNAMLGHWQRDDKVYQVIGVYPAEDVVAQSDSSK